MSSISRTHMMEFIVMFYFVVYVVCFVLIRLCIYEVNVILISLIILSSLSLKHAKNKVVIFRYLSETVKTNMTVSR